MKYKCSKIDNLILLTSCQIDILIALVRRSDERYALVRGVYYKDIKKDVRGSHSKKRGMRNQECSNQTFYNGLKELEKMGIIKVRKASDLDYDVYICGNEYGTDANYSKEPYINFNDDVFYSSSFKNLKAHEKYLFLYFYQYTFQNGEKNTWKKNKKDFYEEMTKKLDVTDSVLRRYLKQLKLFFSIGTLKGNLLITRKVIARKKKKKEKTEERWMIEQYIISECHRLRIKYENSEIKGLVELLKGKRKHFNHNGTFVALGKLLACLEKSVEGYKYKDRELNGGLVNKLFCDKIKRSAYDEQPDMDIIYNSDSLNLCY